MKLNVYVAALDKSFELNTPEVGGGDISLTSEDLNNVVDGLLQQSQPAEPAPPPAPPAKVEYELSADAQYTREQYETSGWTEQQMIDNGILVPVKVEAPEPAPAPVPDAPKAPAVDTVTDQAGSTQSQSSVPAPALSEGQFEHEGAVYKMTLKAQGATPDQFFDQNWTIKGMVDNGFAEPMVDDAIPGKPEYPVMSDDGDWVDSDGVVFDPDKHQSSSNSKTPPVTATGKFKKSRKKPKPAAPAAPETAAPEAPSAPAPEAPMAPPVSEVVTTDAPQAPSAPSAPEAPGPVTIDAVAEVSQTDEDLDPALAGLIKDWS